MAFTAPVFSNANIGTWDYYIMSDNTAVWRALNGLAAWFNGSAGLITGAAGLGALIVLTVILWGAVVHSKSIGTGTLGIWFFFMAMMGMNGTAQVINVYTGQVTLVNNVPALALIPASAFSKAGYAVFTSMETAFASVNGSYMSVNQNAFVGPIDILLALRSPSAPSYTPALNKTLVQVVNDCASNPGGPVAPIALADAPDALQWLQTYGRQTGLTKIYTEFDTTGLGGVADCAAGLAYINNQFSTYAAGSPGLVGFLNAATTKKNPQDVNGQWGTTAVQDSWNFLYGTIPAMAQSAQQFTKNALTATTISYTMDCMSQSGMLTTAENCMAGALAAADGKERWKIEAAMAGSGFLKTMFTSMGFLQVIFLALFPFIAIYGLIVVNKTAAVFGGYILLGVWSQSWMIVVAPIQSYIQTSIIDDMTKGLSVSHAVTMANMNTIYDQLSTKLAVASDLMANAQMLSLALLSGSVYALSGLAGKWGGSGHNDSSLLQQKPLESAAFFKGGSLASVSNFRSEQGGIVQTIEHTGAADWSATTTFMTNLSQTSAKGSSIGSSEQRANQLQAAVRSNTDYSVSSEDAASIIKTSDSATSFTGQMSSAVMKDIMGAMKSRGLIGNLNASQNSFAESAIQKAQGAAANKLAANNPGFMQRLFSEDDEIRGEARGQLAETAVELLTAGAMAAEFASGVGIAATPATIATGLALRQGIKGWVKGATKSRAKTAGAQGKVAAKRESAVMGNVSNLANGVGAIAEGIAGNVGAVARAVITDGIKKSNSYNVSKKNSTGSTTTVSESDGLTRAVTAAVNEGYSESSGKGVTTTQSIKLDHASLSRMATAGIGKKSGQQLMQQAATTAAMARAGQMKKADGSSYTADEIKKADQMVEAAMLGHTTGNVALDNFKRNVIFEQSLTNAVNGSLGDGPGIPVGANFSNELRTKEVAPEAAVAATKGHWEPNRDKTGKSLAKPVDDKTLKSWHDGDDQNNAAGKAKAAKSGYHWVAGTKGKDAVVGGTVIDETSQTNAELPSHVNSGGIGAAMKGGSGSTAYKQVEASVIRGANTAQEQLAASTRTAEEELALRQPGLVKDFYDDRSQRTTEIAVAAAVDVGAGVLGGGLSGARGGRSTPVLIEPGTPGTPGGSTGGGKPQSDTAGKPAPRRLRPVRVKMKRK